MPESIKIFQGFVTFNLFGTTFLLASNRRAGKVAIVYLLWLFCVGIAMAQDVQYGIGSWRESGLGNHRALVFVPVIATNPRTKDDVDAVWAHIQWRRRDVNPQEKDIRVFDVTTGERVMNVVTVNVNREYGDLVFKPATIPGYYAIYYLPYELPTGVWGGDWNRFSPARGEYFLPEKTADPDWVSRNHLSAEELVKEQWKSLPKTQLLEIQARQEFHRFDPMEVIATQQEITQLLSEHFDDSYLLFPEDRKHQIKMFNDLPLRWIENGPKNEFYGKPQPGEYYVFQIGVWAARKQVDDVSVKFAPLKAKGKKKIVASAFHSINLGGNDWLGRPMKRVFQIAKGNVRPLWVGVYIPENAEGIYKSKIVIKPEGAKPKTVNITLQVSGPVLEDGGDSDLWRLSRLRWLDSTKGEDVFPPYTPLKVNGSTVECLNRKVKFGKLGLPVSIVSNDKEILDNPIEMVVETSEGKVKWQAKKSKYTEKTDGKIEQTSRAKSKDLLMSTWSKTEFDGCITFKVNFEAKKNIDISDIALKVPLRREVATYMMGMGRMGGYMPEDQWKWAWNIDRADNLVWIGDADAGLQCKLMGPKDTWELSNLKVSGVPQSWNNDGKGGATISEVDGRVLLHAFSGARKMEAGQQLQFQFRLLITPFKPIDSNHWNWRYGDIAKGGNIQHIHHSVTAENPYINYPFLTTEKLTARIKDLKSKGAGMTLYYTVRELSNHVAEMWALRSLGDEVFRTGGIDIYMEEELRKFDQDVASNELTEAFRNADKGAEGKRTSGGYMWLREHMVSGYQPAWWTPLPGNRTISNVKGWGYYSAIPPSFPDSAHDASIRTTGLSRWHNYYVEGLAWLMKNTGVDGLYLDGIGYDRQIMKRVASVMHRVNGQSRINFHSGNGYRVKKMSSANTYMEHFPYISNLYFGEIFDSTYKLGPDKWLIEVSGIPFGLTSEIHRHGGNHWKGMLYGSTIRWWDLQDMWRFWDEFGIQETEMIGYWSPSCPVKTGRDDILTTVYQKKDKALIVVASWADQLAKVQLEIDWKALGLNETKAKLYAPAIKTIQEEASFSPNGEIPVEPNKGWILVLE